MTTLKTACPCGQVHLEISGDAAAQFYCHCDDCQSAYSAAYVSISLHPAGAVKVVQGTLKPFVVKSTPRMRCAGCGTSIFSELTAFGMRGVNAYLLPKDSFKPQFHEQCQFAVLPVVDKLPHFKGFPASFGGSDEVIAW